MTSFKKLFADFAERSWSTGIEAGLGYLVTVALDWNPALGAGLAAGFAIIKCLIASRIGNPGSASLLPSSLDPKITEATIVIPEWDEPEDLLSKLKYAEPDKRLIP